MVKRFNHLKIGLLPIAAKHHPAITNYKGPGNITEHAVNFFQLRADRVRMLVSTALPLARCPLSCSRETSHQTQAVAMTISISGRYRDRFRADLLAHRETFSLNDSEYADQVLKVSLNTYKKCVQSSGRRPLALKRHTVISIFANTVLDPKNYGLSIGVPSQASTYGGYQKNDFQFLCGRFFLYRRSFLTARHITRSILSISMSDSHECLSFNELHYYTSEAGGREEIHYHGDVYMNRERSILSLPAYFQGQVRLTLLQPERLSRKIKMRGALLAFGNPKGYWQPTVSCVFVDGPIDQKLADPRDLCKTILDGSEEYATLSAELARVEEHATIITPLMWAKIQASADKRNLAAP
jgi:hypothetical protein